MSVRTAFREIAKMFPLCGQVERQPNHSVQQHFKWQCAGAHMKGCFRQYRLTSQSRPRDSFRESHGPKVMSVVNLKKGYKKTCVYDRIHLRE